MRTKGIMQTKKDERREKILTEAYRIFVEKKIEPVSMGEIAEAAGIGRATLFRYYSSKLELVIAVCTREWKAYLDALDQVRPINSVGEIPAIGRLIFTLDSYIEMYQSHKALLCFNDNFNHYVSHEGCEEEQLEEFHAALYSVETSNNSHKGGEINENFSRNTDSLSRHNTGCSLRVFYEKVT